MPNVKLSPYILKADKLETQENKTLIVDKNSTNEQYPSAKAVYDALAKGEGVGEATEEGGEIFNDYDNNKAIGDYTSASGNATRAGGRGYHIIEAEYIPLNDEELVEVDKLKASWKSLGDKIDGIGIGRYFNAAGSNMGYISKASSTFSGSLPSEVNLGRYYGQITLEGAGTLTSSVIKQVVLFEQNGFTNTVGAIDDIRFFVKPTFAGTGDIKIKASVNFSSRNFMATEFIIPASNSGQWVEVSFNDMNNGNWKSAFGSKLDDKPSRLEVCFSGNNGDTLIVGSILEVVVERVLPDGNDKWTSSQWVQEATKVKRNTIANAQNVEQFNVDINSVDIISKVYRTIGILTQPTAPDDWGSSKHVYFELASDGSFSRIIFSEKDEDGNPVVDFETGKVIIQPEYEPNKYYDFQVTNDTTSNYRLKLILNDSTLESDDRAFEKYNVGDIVNLDIDYHQYKLFYISSLNYDGDGNTIIYLSPRVSYNFIDGMTGALKYINLSVPTYSQLGLETNVGDDAHYYNWVWVDSKPEAGEVLPQAIGSNANGVESTACGEGAAANGCLSKALGNYSFSSGLQNESLYAATSLGRDNHALGEHSLAGGKSSYASKHCALAFGERTQSMGIASTCIGYGTVATGDYSIAMGYGAHSSGIYSSAIGKHCKASADNAVAMGNSCESTFMNTFTAGEICKAKGRAAVAMGVQNEALAAGSTAFGLGNIAKGYGQTVVGYYNHPIGSGNTLTPNETLDTALFIVGNGTPTTKSNAFEVYKDGHVEIQKGLSIANNDIIINKQEFYWTDGGNKIWAGVEDGKPRTIISCGDVDVDSFRITGLGEPQDDTDAATKAYVDNLIGCGEDDPNTLPNLTCLFYVQY